jgi:protein deglycase
MKILVPLAEGFEEIEAITIIDVLRRASLDVTTAAISGNPVTGSHGIPVTADTHFTAISPDAYDAVVLPGGMPGSGTLRDTPALREMLKIFAAQRKITAAICAAPMVLGAAGILAGRRATCFPGFENYLTGAMITGDAVTVDDTIITARGAGCALAFSLKLVELIKGKAAASTLASALQMTDYTG